MNGATSPVSVVETLLSAREFCAREQFKRLDVEGHGSVSVQRLAQFLAHEGISHEDLVRETYESVGLTKDAVLGFAEYFDLVNRPDDGLLTRALHHALAIPSFREFEEEVERIFDSCELTFPPRAGAGSEVDGSEFEEDSKFGLSICSVDGQILNVGDIDARFGLYEAARPLLYCATCAEEGSERVHEVVGVEPARNAESNPFTLNSNGKPHNPLTPAGTIAVSSVFKSKTNVGERYQEVVDVFNRLASPHQFSFCMQDFLAQCHDESPCLALAHFLKSQRVLAKCIEPGDLIKLLCHSLSLETTCEAMSVVAGTLANEGKHPLTQEQVFPPRVVRDCLALLSTCGSGSFDREWSFHVSLPSFSSSSGYIVAIVPGVLGIAVLSRDCVGQRVSKRGANLVRELVSRFALSTFGKPAFPARKAENMCQGDWFLSKHVPEM